MHLLEQFPQTTLEHLWWEVTNSSKVFIRIESDYTDSATQESKKTMSS